MAQNSSHIVARTKEYRDRVGLIYYLIKALYDIITLVKKRI